MQGVTTIKNYQLPAFDEVYHESPSFPSSWPSLSLLPPFTGLGPSVCSHSLPSTTAACQSLNCAIYMHQATLLTPLRPTVCLRFAFYSSAADRISEWPTASLSGSCSCKHRWMALPPFNGPSSLLILLHFIQFIGGGRSNNGQGNESKASFVLVILNGSSRVTIMALVCYEWQRMEP